MRFPLITSALVVAACASAPAPYANPLTITYAPSLAVDLSKASKSRRGIFILDTREGPGAIAQSGSRTKLHYTLYLPDGKAVQTTRNGEPFAVKLDDPRFLIGEAIVGMKVGGRRMLVVPPERGYGRDGVPGLVPPNTTLVFAVELIAVESLLPGQADRERDVMLHASS